VTLNVTFGDNNFTPATLTAAAGRPVQLKLANGGQRPHTFTIDGVVDSGRMNAGENKDVQFTPSQAGSLQFYCTVHGREQMNGTLTVSASGAADDDSIPDEASALGR
jgi:plastocyanin